MYSPQRGLIMPSVALQGMLTEEELMKVLGLKKTDLAYLRGKGMPYVELSKTRRVYLEADLMAWFKKRTVTKESE